MQTHPIAGTRPRGRTEDEDQRLGEELKRNEKERAEHVMLVDLGRNDLGRVCEYGSVRVPTYMTLERYSHVMHLVSVVDGKLDESHDRLDALVACFPAGTVSGAPKVRAMEIVAELEGGRRGVYAGAVGYLDFAGNLDFCITIRTVLIENGRAYVQAGAGIVADSNPTAEYEETRDKARAVSARARAGAARAVVMVLVIDNYDSFTYNLVQYFGELGADIRVRRNNQVTLGEIGAMAPDHIVISPGPGRPENAGRVARRHPPVRPVHAGAGRVPGSPGDRHRLWRHRDAGEGADARQDVGRHARRQGALHRRDVTVSSGPLSLARDRGPGAAARNRSGGAHA